MLESFSIELTPGWRWFIVIFLLLSGLVIWWGYRNAGRLSGLTFLGMLSKILGILLVLFILLEPVTVRKKAVPGLNEVAVLIDTSQTMTMIDPGSGIPVNDNLTQWISESGMDWVEDLARNFKVRFYAVDSTVKSVVDPRELEFSGDSSALNTGLAKISRSYRNKPLAGVVLFTDGIPTDKEMSSDEMESLPPTFVVPTSDVTPVRDARIRSIRIRESAFEDAPVEVEIETEADGLAGKKMAVEITSLDGEAVFREEFVISGNKESKTFRADWKPAARGLKFYEVAVSVDLGSINPNDRVAEEITLLNNSRWISIDHGQDPQRILYVAGRPNWEFKFLNRAMAEDPLLELTGLIRIAKREPKFQFKGRSGETSNPLFRGFDKQDEETEKYDQPVLKRINVRDERELSDGFPSTEEELFKFDAIILDDLESDFFTRTQLNLIKEFVSRRGGGLMMLGGMESMAEGNYQDTPLKDVIPVYLNNIDAMDSFSSVRLELTDEGWLEKWARIRTTEAAEVERRNDLVPYQAINFTGRQKPGASVIATASDDTGTPVPVLVTQRYGRGKSLSLAVTDFWRPGMRSPEAMEDVKKSWRQMVRWMVTDVPERLDLSLAPSSVSPHSVDVETLVLNEEFYPLDNASVKVSVSALRAKADERSQWDFESLPSNRKAGVLETSFNGRTPGPYRIKASVADMDGIPIGDISAGWVSNPLAEEFARLTPDTAWIQSLAKLTGGDVFSLDEVTDLVSRLEKMDLPETTSEAYPLWHSPWIMLLAMLLFAAEWTMRRMRGLP